MAEPNFDNRTLFHGDNLAFLRGINSESIDLVATDPPFNKGKDFHATPDSLAAGASFHDRWSWERDVEGEWEDAIKDDWPAVQRVIESANAAWGRDMGAFLCYMGVRLLEMHRILKPTGSLYLHCDPTASHYLKAMLDAIFGRENFRNDIVWCYTGPGNVTRWFPRKHDDLLFYVKSDEAAFNRDAVRIPYKQLNVQHAEEGGGGIGGDLTPDNVADYREKGKIPEDYWLEDRDGMSPVGRRPAERTGYPTQKPIALYRRIVEASSSPGDIVLDPFCGCATTLIAAEQAGRQWIGIDLWDEALQTVRDRVEKECQNLFGGDVFHSEVPPNRTDEGENAAPPLKSKAKRRVAEPGKRQTRQEMMDILIEEHGITCQGCDREFDDPRYLDLDHNTPRSQGGLNHISNRLLLCGPCNRAKGDTLTLKGLRQLNAKNGWMAK